jgi:hypothetical protein
VAQPRHDVRVRRRRALALGAVVAVHGLALLALLWAPKRAIGSGAGSLTVIALAGPSATTPPTAPRVKAPPPDSRIGQQALAPAPAAAAEQPGAGDVCAPLETISAGLSEDTAAIGAVERLPFAEPTADKPIVVWSAGWSTLALDAGAPLAPVRVRIQSDLARVPDACLNAPLIGPRILPLATREGTHVLVFGSGEWRWADMLDEPAEIAVKDGLADLRSLFLGILDEP